MRRHAWQIGGLMVAVGAMVVLAIVAFGRGDNARAIRTTGHPTGTPRATATADLRVAEVQAAARRYVEALAASMRTGSAAQLDALCLPGSQAQGNAGVVAGIVQHKHVAFVATDTMITSLSVDMNETTAVATIDYEFTGYDADWPSLHPRAAPRTMTFHAVLEFSLAGARWLVDSSR